jgi:hypothetical protein
MVAPTPPVPRFHESLHRSGTSLLASALEQAGLSIGDRLLGATLMNGLRRFVAPFEPPC